MIDKAGNYNLFDVSVGMGLSFTALVPLIPGIEASLFGTFGLGPMSLDFQARLDAALGIGIEWNPFLSLQALADVSAGIAAGNILPTLAIQANADLAADLSWKLLGIQAQISAMLSLQSLAASALGALNGAATLGVMYVVHHGTVGSFGSEVPAKIQELAGGDVASPLYSITIAVDAAASWSALGNVFLLS